MYERKLFTTKNTKITKEPSPFWLTPVSSAVFVIFVFLVVKIHEDFSYFANHSPPLHDTAWPVTTRARSETSQITVPAHSLGVGT